MWEDRLAAGAGWLLRRRLWVVAATLILTAFALWRVSGMRVDADILNMLEEDDPARADFERFSRRSPLTGALFVVTGAESDERLRASAVLLGRIEGVAGARVWPIPYPDWRLIVVQLEFSPADVASSRRVIGAVRRLLGAQGLEGRLAGTPAVVVESHEAVTRDLRRGALITAAAVSGFFLLFYRAGVLALLSLVPIGVGMAVGLAVASAFTNRLNLMATALPSLFIGLGIDYCIHIVQATGVQVRAGAERRAALVRAWATLLRPLSVGALTTAAAFFSLGIARLAGLGEMGRMAGITLLTTFVSCLVLMPILLSFCPSRWLVRGRAMSAVMGRLGPWVKRHRVGLLGLGAGAMLAAGVGLSRLRLETDNSRLEDADLPARVVQRELARKARLSTAPLILTFDSWPSAWAFGAALRRESGARLIGLQPLPLEEGAGLTVHLAGNPYSEPVYRGFLEAKERAERASGVRPQEFTGGPVVNAWMSEILRRDWTRLLAASSATVVALLILGAWSLRAGLLALIPLACGLAWTGGFMGLAGHRLSIMGAAVAPLVLGIGVDDGVHLLMAMRRCRGDLRAVFEDTGVAVVATTVTTVSAFGALCFSRTPALVIFGWQSSFGLICCLLSSLFLLPALWFGADRSAASERETGAAAGEQAAGSRRDGG